MKYWGHTCQDRMFYQHLYIYMYLIVFTWISNNRSSNQISKCHQLFFKVFTIKKQCSYFQYLGPQRYQHSTHFWGKKSIFCWEFSTLLSWWNSKRTAFQRLMSSSTEDGQARQSWFCFLLCIVGVSLDLRHKNPCNAWGKKKKQNPNYLLPNGGEKWWFSMVNGKQSGWWFQPPWKMLVKLDHSPR